MSAREKKLRSKTIQQIAVDVIQDWDEKTPAGKAYLAAMLTVTEPTESFGLVKRFLKAAKRWRGPLAADVKAELQLRLDPPNRSGMYN